MLEILRSAQFRLSIMLAFIVAVSTSIVFAFVYWHVTTADMSRLSIILTDEVAKGLSRTNEQLKRELDLRLTRDLRRLDYAALFDEEGAPIFGNLSRMPASVPIDGRAHYTEAYKEPAESSEKEPAIFVAGRRSDGSILVLGRGLFETYYLRHTVLEALVYGVLTEIALALTVGGVFGLLAMRRLQNIHQMIDRIMAGALHERLPEKEKPDDIDRIVRAVNQMLDELVRALGQLRSMGANIAHDLRTPLSILRVKLERGLSGKTDEDLRTVVQQANIELEKSLTTISALMRIAELESGRRRSAFRHVDIRRLCSEVYELYEPLADQKSLIITLENESKSLTVYGDADLLREAIANLVDNAVKYCVPGGKVAITTADRDGDPLIRVCDNGPGVTSEERDKIFNRFYRSERHRHLSGSGLGLSMAATVVELHGFSIGVRDNNPGACFEIICIGAVVPVRGGDSNPGAAALPSHPLH